MTPYTRVSTGIKGLDEILSYLQMGDNVVLQVDDIEDYKKFVDPYVKTALAKNRRLVYMRFANHAPVLEDNKKIKMYKLNANKGFESFSTQVHNIVRDEGRDVFYVFDCLSDLLIAWATDLMIGNFFVITCPYLFELNTVAYFAILRSRHSFKTVARIRETTQVLLDIYNNKGKIYIHPLKAWKRYTPTMYLPHVMKAEKFVPILNSADAANILSFLTDKNVTSGVRNLDYWDRIFLKANTIMEDPKAVQEKQDMVETLSRVMIGREKECWLWSKNILHLRICSKSKNVSSEPVSSAGNRWACFWHAISCAKTPQWTGPRYWKCTILFISARTFFIPI